MYYRPLDNYILNLHKSARGTTETSLKVLVYLRTLTIKWGPSPYL